RGLRELRVEPNPALQFINPLVPINPAEIWKGMPLFCGSNLNASAPLPVGAPLPSRFLPAQNGAALAIADRRSPPRASLTIDEDSVETKETVYSRGHLLCRPSNPLG